MWPTSKEGNPNIYITAPFIMQFYIKCLNYKLYFSLFLGMVLVDQREEKQYHVQTKT